MIVNFRILRIALGYPSITNLSAQSDVVSKAELTIRVYYASNLFLIPIILRSSIWSKTGFEPTWPVAWLTLVGVHDLMALALLQCVSVAIIIAGIFLYKYRLYRAIFFLCIWQIHALESSYGQVNHQWYLWLYTSGILAALPYASVTDAVEKKMKFLLAIWFAQAIVVVAYTMAGLNKFIVAIEQFARGEVSSFSLHGASYIVAGYVSQSSEPVLLADLIISNPLLGFIALQLIMVLQISSFWVLLRPVLQRIWAALIIAFHIATLLAMGIFFQQHVALIVALFVFSPFVPEKYRILDILRAFPGGITLGHVVVLARRLPFYIKRV